MNPIFKFDMEYGRGPDAGVVFVLDKHTILWDDGTISKYWYDVVKTFDRDPRSEKII